MLKDSLFWEMSGGAADADPSIIFGTIHLSHPIAISKFDRVRKFLDSYEDVYTESELGDNANSKIQSHISMPEADSYLQYLTAKQIDKLSKICKKACNLELKSLLRLRPLFIQSILCASLLESGSDQVLDQRIWNCAANNGSNVAGIESTHEQIKILKSLSIDTEYKQLVRLGQNITRYRKHLFQLLEAYRLEQIGLLYKKSKNTFGFDKKLMLYDRNKVMAQRIEDWHNSKPSFFSFGAGHLAGQKGVLNLLKLRGFSLKAIR